MNRTRLTFLLTLAALPALAQDRQAVGFTQDGETFVLMTSADEEDPRYFLHDPRTGTAQATEDGLDVLTPAQFKAWTAESPLAPLKTGPRSPDGKTQLEAGKGGSWKDGQFLVRPTCDGDDGKVHRAPPKTTFRTKAGKKSWASADLDLGQWNADASVEPVWSPDGRRVAYVTHVTNGCHGAASDHMLAFGPAQGPRVQVLSVKERPYGDTVEAMEALEGAGFFPTGYGEAKGTHAGTVVFATKGFEAEAKKAAAALPGARVDKLTWKPGYELVVVLGDK